MADIKKTEEAPGMVFPCSIKVKIFVKNHSEEEREIRQFVAEQLEAHHLLGWSSRVSSGSKYLAISANVDAQSREHIDAFYQALTNHERVIMLL
jgi:putative lipoic acid-binding regulatory protein